MKSIKKFEEDKDEHTWVFTLECGHEVVSPVGPGTYTAHGVLCSQCLKESTDGQKP